MIRLCALALMFWPVGVFAQTEHMADASVESLLLAICTVVAEETRGGDTPRNFALTRLVEVAETVGRHRTAFWVQIWPKLSQQLLGTCTKSSTDALLVVVNHVRQLVLRMFTYPTLCAAWRRLRGARVRERDPWLARRMEVPAEATAHLGGHQCRPPSWRRRSRLVTKGS